LIVLMLLVSFYSSSPAEPLDLLWSTFLGGSGDDYGTGIAADDSGWVYVAGQSLSIDFPAAEKGSRPVRAERDDAFLAKLSASGQVLMYLTIVGGDETDAATGVAADVYGNAYLTGWTNSSNFPVTPAALDATLDGDQDAFLAKLNAGGSLLEYATYLGGGGEEEGTAIAVDAARRVSLTGSTDSPDFPVSASAYDTSHNGGRDVFAVQFTDWGGTLEFSTLIGGSGDETGRGIAMDQGGNVYLTGVTDSPDYPTTMAAYDTSYGGGLFGDAFATKVHLTGSALSYSTFLGAQESDLGQEIAVERDKGAVVIGFTDSPDFPTTPGALDTSYNGGGYDLFLARLDPWGQHLSWSTFLGGGDEDLGYGLALDPDGRAFVAGFTRSDDLPVTPDAFAAQRSGAFDIFVMKLGHSAGGLLYSTYLGGKQDDYVYGHCLAADDSGNIYLTGYTLSAGFPATPEALDTTHGGGFDAVLAKVGPDDSTPVGDMGAPQVEAQRPRTARLSQNVPNPFNASTRIRYHLPEAAEVSLKIYNIAGQIVRTLVNASRPAGFHAAVWDGTGDDRQTVASGIYFCRLQTGRKAGMIKMALVR
jgi:hypothetical protein